MDKMAPAQVEATLRQIWSEVLDLPPERVSSDANFFALGGDSLLVIRVMDRVNTSFFGSVPDGGIPVADFFTYGTVRELTRRVIERDGRISAPAPDAGSLSGAIAIIAMQGRFPGAPNVEAFWRALCDGRETLRFFSDEELIAAGVPARDLADPRYVKSAALLDDVQTFDAEHFGLTPAEAAMMSPEQRLLIECAQEALEAGGYAARWRNERVGVFVGSGLSSYLIENCYSRLPQLESSSGMRTLVATTGAATRVSYLLNLSGPSVTIDTACSSSLVAIHVACRALLNGECEMALAGGATVRRFAARGYRAEAGGIFSPDGHCRPFDRWAQGTVASSGAGLVLLKRLEDACADRDTLCAVIRGTAVNNDGNAKVGYTAPSAAGQAAAIRSAYRAAGVEPRTVGYIETHGTATPLGDAIEIAALKEVFAENPRCALGTLKANMGHMEAAAGVAALMKAALALERGRLPPNIHFREVNPQISIEGTPFFLNTALENWTESAAPRRAGVSSFGIGGTNAHAVLEQAPPEAQSCSHRSSHPLTISARTPATLQARLRDLVRHLSDHPELNIADVAFSLQVGRVAYPARAFCVCGTVSEAVEALELEAQRCSATGVRVRSAPPVVFMFPGQGSQHLRMTAGLYVTEPAFREQIDLCAQLLSPNLGIDIRDFIQPPEASGQHGAWLANALSQTRWCQPALFAVEYALGRLWQSWGVSPSFMIGHSLGEYVAACLSGVFSLEDALTLVCHRARLMQQAPPGKMLAVRRPRNEVHALLTPGCTIAAVNADTRCVVAGPAESIASMKQLLERRQVECALLETSHAFHSPLMQGVCEEFAAVLERVEMREVGLPYVSNIDGELLPTGTRLAREYWLKQLCQPVEFAQGIVTLSQGRAKLFLEVGPGNALTASVRATANAKPPVAVVASCRHPKQANTDSQCLMQAVGQLWKAGVAMDWPAFNAFSQCRRVRLPTTPFQRRRHWIETSAPASADPGAAENGTDVDVRVSAGASASASASAGAGADADAGADASADTSADALRVYAPFWKQTLSPSKRAEAPKGVCLLFEQRSELTDGVAKSLIASGWPVVRVRAASPFGAAGPAGRDERACDERARDERRHDQRCHDEPGYEKRGYDLDPHERGGCDRLLADIGRRGLSVGLIVYAWRGETGAMSLLDLCQSLGNAPRRERVQLIVLTAGANAVLGEGITHPEGAMLSTIARVAAREIPWLSSRSIDVSDTSEAFVQAAVAEMLSATREPIVALRGSARWVPTYEPLDLTHAATRKTLLRPRGVYLITGGLGGIGCTLATFLARSVQARLVLVSRSALNETSERARAIRAMEALGSEVLVVQADVSSAEQMRAAVTQACKRFGAVHGVIHAAGIGGTGLVARRDRATALKIIEPKVAGTLETFECVKSLQPDFFILCSSLASILAPARLSDYAAACAFQDAFAQSRDGAGGMCCISIDWDVWKEVGMGVTREALPFGLSNEEGCRAFDLILRNPRPQWIVSTREIGRALSHTERLAERQRGRHAERRPEDQSERQRECHAERQVEDQAERQTVDQTARRVEHQLARQAVREPRVALARPGEPPPRVEASCSPCEEAIRHIWSELLGIPEPDLHADFFEQGGDSLLAVQLGARLETYFETTVTLEQILRAPTIAALARQIGG